MKYMTFKASCSFAGVANMLLRFGVDVEDYQIALGMHLPCLFDLRDGVYLAGPMLQTSDTFNLYLNTLGYTMVETPVKKSDLVDYLSKCDTAMFGLRISPNEKHAVVFAGFEDEKLVLINNKREDSEAHEKLYFSKESLKERTDDIVMVATIEKAPISIPDFGKLFTHSCRVLEQYKIDIQTFCSTEKTKKELLAAMNVLFRATLLDGITMLELIGKIELAEQFRYIQQSFLRTIQTNDTVILCEKINLSDWLCAIDQYIALIHNMKCQTELFLDEL